MPLPQKLAIVAAALALAAPGLAAADTYTLANFSGAIFGGNANAQAPFGAAGITQGMALSGSFLIDNDIAPAAVGYDNIFYSNYPDAATIPAAIDFNFNLGSLNFTAAQDTGLAAIQYNNGHFNGFAYSDDFIFQNVGYNLTISGGTFGITEQDTGQQFVSGYINIGDGGVTGGTPYTPPPPDNGGGGGGGGVPEPATWAMLIVGFGGVGGLLRRRRAFAPA
ncbi:MAG: PEPxxWA-CTERM sorting domain-containing protein [Phenylobacterium sp.]